MSFESLAKKLMITGQDFYRRGWVLGTSGNFSAKVPDEDNLQICITASGTSKGNLDETNFLEIDDNADVLQGFGTPSAETLLHLTIYRLIPSTASILHTHSVWGTILSDVFITSGAIDIQGYEMLKGLSGVTTHRHRETVPLIENSQDYIALASVIENVIRENPGIHGIYLRRHGLYTWGRSIPEARRHIEVFEFLFEVLARQMQNRQES